MSKKTYKWAVETTGPDQNINDVVHSDTLAELIERHDPEDPDPGESHELALIRDVGTEEDGVLDRQWAYPECRVLPGGFDGGANVPNRFQLEWYQNLPNIPASMLGTIQP